MANRYWVGGTGNWSDNTNHWSATSNGTPGASLPTSADNVFFDEYSFTATGQNVNINTDANCLDMDWSAVAYNPKITDAASLVKKLYVYGSLTLASTMTSATTIQRVAVYFKSTTAGRTITTAGIVMKSLAFDGVGGEWTLLDGSVTPIVWTLINGSLNTNGNSIACSNFLSSNTNERTLTLGSSVITLSGGWTIIGTNLTFDAGTSTIITTGAAAVFTGGGLTYNNVEFKGTSTTIKDNNTFNDLKATATKTVNFTAGTTQAVMVLSGAGTSGSLVTIQSTTAGTPYTISKSSGSLTADYYSIQDCTASGGATFRATNSTDVSGNTGWSFFAWFAPNLKPRIDGAIKSMVGGSVRIDGALKTIDSMWARIDGALKKL